MTDEPQKPTREIPENIKAEVLARAAEGLKSFIAMGRTLLQRDHPEIYDAAVKAVADDEAVELITVKIGRDSLIVSLCLVGLDSELPRPLFSIAGNALPDVGDMH